MKNSVLILGIVLGAVGVAAIMLRGKDSGIKVNITPNILNYGDIANWGASGLTPGGKWQAQILGYGGQTIVLYGDMADQFGNAANRFTFSTNVPTGLNRLTVVDVASGNSGSVDFTVS